MFYYSNEASIVNQWDDVHNLTCAGVAEGLPCYKDGEEIFKLLDFSKSHFGRDIGLLVVIWIFTRALSFFILLYKAKKHK